VDAAQTPASIREAAGVEPDPARNANWLMA